MVRSLRPRARQAIGLAALLLTAFATVSVPAAQSEPAAARETDRYLQSRMRALDIPGLQAVVVRDGRVVFSRSYGTASIELDVPMTQRTVLAVNSIAKAFTGVAAMQLVEAGRLDLSAAVSTYLDSLPQSWRPVTIRQLLSHTSGLPDVARAPTVETDAEAAWQWTLAQPVRFPPGARFNYSQTNYTLLQRIVNRLRGEPPETSLGLPQFAAAGLRNTHYGDAYDLIPSRALSYRFDAPRGVRGPLRPAVERFLPFRRAASGLNSTAEDIGRWIIALRNGDLLRPSSLETIWTPIAFNDGRIGQWGLGWQVLRRSNHRAVGMTGGGRAGFYIYPEQDVAVVIVTNLAGSFPEDFIDKIASIYAPDLRLDGIPALRIALDEQGYDKAEETARLLARASPETRWDEAELNDWGYRLLSSGRPRDALQILKLTASLFPQSSNALDSLADAYEANGDAAQAVVHFRRALELDPNNAWARQQLERLTG